MAHAALDRDFEGKKSFSTGYLFGAPVRDMGFFGSLLMAVGGGFAAFFLGTGVAIFSILFWNAGGHHADFAAAYRLVGLPVGIVVMVAALAYLGTFWVKRKLRKG